MTGPSAPNGDQLDSTLPIVERPGEPLSKSKPSRPNMSSWGQEVEAKALKLRDRLPQVSEEHRAELDQLITEAMDLCTPATSLFSWGRFVDWWYGNRVERAWTLLHHAELTIIDNSDEGLLPELMEDAVEHAAALEQTDPARNASY